MRSIMSFFRAFKMEDADIYGASSWQVTAGAHL